MGNQVGPQGPGAHPLPVAPFLFYSSLHGRRVVDRDGVDVGRIEDLAVDGRVGDGPGDERPQHRPGRHDAAQLS
jgi:hypothetical protein